jgi:hypothetical protein
MKTYILTARFQHYHVTLRYAGQDRDGFRPAIVSVFDMRRTRVFRKRCRCKAHPSSQFIAECGPRRKSYKPGVIVFDGIQPRFIVSLNGNGFDGQCLDLDLITISPALP